MGMAAIQASTDVLDQLRALENCGDCGATTLSETDRLWCFLSRPGFIRIVDAETVDLLEDNSCKQSSLRVVSATKLEGFLRDTLLSRREVYLHPPSRISLSGSRSLGVPDAVIIETQPGYGSRKITQLFGTMYGVLDMHYDTLWRSGVVDRIPRVLNDSGRTKGHVAHVVEENALPTFASWMQHECDARDFALWLATEHREWMNSQEGFADRVLDNTAKRCLRIPDMDEFRRIISASFKNEARARLGRDPDWLRRLDQAEEAEFSKKKGRGGTKGKPRSHSEFVATVFGDDQTGEAFLDETRTDKDRTLQHMGDAEQEVNRYVAQLPPHMRVNRTKRKERQENREWNKLKVLCAVETLLETTIIGKKEGGQENAEWVRAWNEWRSASRAELRNKRRDMADAILQGIGNVWKAVFSGMTKPTAASRKRVRSKHSRPEADAADVVDLCADENGHSPSGSDLPTKR